MSTIDKSVRTCSKCGLVYYMGLGRLPHECADWTKGNTPPEQPALTEAEAQLVIGAIPLQALPEQPAREADEWHVERDPIHGCSVVTKGRIVAANIYRPEDADQIVTNHARAALVPGLVAALHLSLLERVEMNGRCDHEPNISEDCFQCHLRSLIDAARKAGVE